MALARCRARRHTPLGTVTHPLVTLARPSRTLARLLGTLSHLRDPAPAPRAPVMPPRNPGTLLGTVTSPLGTLSPHGWGGAAGDAVRHPPPPRCRTRGHPGTPRPSLLTPGHVTATSRCHRRHPRPRPPRRPARRPLRGVPASPCRPPARPPAPLTRTEPPGSVPCRPVAVPRLSPRRVMAGNEPHYSCLGND